MKLYSGPLSLFSRKVEIALREKDIPFERIEVPFSQTRGYHPRHPDVLAANPKGQVPVLVDGDLTLYDSTLIIEYLEDAYPEPALLPRAPADRARCRLLDLFADEIMLTPLRALMHRTEPRENPERWAASEARTAPAEARPGRAFRRSRPKASGPGLPVRRLLGRRHLRLHGGSLGPPTQRRIPQGARGPDALVRPARAPPGLRGDHDGHPRGRPGPLGSRRRGRFLELFPLTWNQLSSLLRRIFDGEPDPLRRKML